VTWQRERFRSQRPTHRISRFNWQRRYGTFIKVPDSYRTWIKASAGCFQHLPKTPSRSNRFRR
jgi:hypothetical protein